jgi:alpha-beta hydrolase superfamily lysophospholipase
MLKFSRHQENPDAVRVIVAVHGIGVHRTDMFQALKGFLDDSILVVVDLPGHGENLGSKTGRKEWSGFLRDLRECVVALQEELGLPVFVLGESLGVNAISPLIADSELKLSGAILVSPPYAVSWKILLSPRSLFDLPNVLGIGRKAHIRLDSAQLEAANSSEEFIAERQVDPLYASKIPTDLLIYASLSLWKSLLSRNFSRIPILLVVSDKDTVIGPRIARLVIRLASRGNAETIRHNKSHTWLHQSGSRQLLAGIRSWLQPRTTD